MDDPVYLTAQRDEIAKAVGLALSTWTIIETRITGLFLTISSVQDKNKGYLIVDAIVSFDARLKIVTQLIAASDWPELEQVMWAKLVERIQKQQKKRNEIAHFMLVNTSNGKQTEAVLVPYYSHGKAMRGESKPLREKDINERSTRFRELAIAVAWFDGFASRLGLQPPISFPQDTDLIQDIRKLAALSLEAQKRPPQS